MLTACVSILNYCGQHQVQRAYQKGAMESGNLAGGKTGSSTTYTLENVRGDYMGWFTGNEEHLEWKQLPEFLNKIDTLVTELKDSGHAEGLSRVDGRSNAMCTVYPGSLVTLPSCKNSLAPKPQPLFGLFRGPQGARYIRHCDNPNANGRILTVIYYMNPEWQKGDGGELRIYSCLKAGASHGFTDCDGKSLEQWDAKYEGSEPEEKAATSFGPGMQSIGTVLGTDVHKPVKVDEIEPLGDRLLLFYSNTRAPHEVLPANTFRYAITTWFMSTEERNAALANGDIALENDKVQAEMASLAQRYGGKPQEHTEQNVASKPEETSACCRHADEPVAQLESTSESSATGTHTATGDADTLPPVERANLEAQDAPGSTDIEQPQYSLEERDISEDTGAARRELEVSVLLPLIKGIQEVELEVSSRCVPGVLTHFNGH
eukprot:9499953-Pyramimonas_sp.AAC.1